ncbi:MAG: acyl-CoA thioesterase [Marinilabiliaceae bacterium]|nr:acyl-CoA thioesterase [Marinilabiliaceae bacterium]
MEFQLSDFNHHLDIQIRFNDVDGFRHVNNSIMFEYFDLGRMSYLSEILKLNYELVDDENLVIVSTKTDFILPIHLGDSLKVYTKLFQIGEKSVSMIQWLIKNGDNKPSVTCLSVLAGFNTATETSMIIPDKWKKLLTGFEKELLLNK